jgi:acyl carrier protein
LVLTGRSGFPPRKKWNHWLAEDVEAGAPTQDVIRRKIQSLRAMEEMGAEVMVVSADVADESQMQRVVGQVLERFGTIHGVIHAAATTHPKALSSPIREMGRVESEEQFRSKARGLYVLEKVLQGRRPDFHLLLSSNASILGGLGFVSYCAANAFLDAFAFARYRPGGTAWISSNWDGWPAGDGAPSGSRQTSMDRYTMTAAESAEAFRRVVTMSTASQVIVSTGDLDARLDLWRRRGLLQDEAGERQRVLAVGHSRPGLQIEYVAPGSQTEQAVAEIWQELLGIDRVGVHDGFFELGGHSLLATQVLSRVREVFRVEVPLRSIFEAPTVAGLAEAIERARGDDAAVEAAAIQPVSREMYRMGQSSAEAGDSP